MFDLAWVERTEGLLQSSDWPEAANQSDRKSATEASVLIPLFRRDNNWHLLFIRRSDNENDRHSGQVAFPGGRRDPVDRDAGAVAVREAHEEIGLDPAHVTVVHQLSEYHTLSDYVITPVVAIVPWPYQYQPQQSEVGRIFSIPLAWIADEQNVQLRDRAVSRQSDRRASQLKVVYFDKYDGEVLWGATARMTISFLKCLRDRELDLDRLLS